MLHAEGVIRPPSDVAQLRKTAALSQESCPRRCHDYVLAQTVPFGFASCLTKIQAATVELLFIPMA